MEKLFNKIGLKGLHNAAPFWLDSIAGMSAELVTNISKSPSVNEATFWTSLIEGSKILFRSFLQIAITNCKDFHYVLSSTPNVKLEMSSQPGIVPATNRVMTIISDDSFDEFSLLEIKTFSFCVKEAFTGTINVYDLKAGFDPLLLNNAPIPVEAQAGRNIVELAAPLSIARRKEPLEIAVVLQTNEESYFRPFTAYSTDTDLAIDAYVCGLTDLSTDDETDLLLAVGAELDYDFDAIADAFADKPMFVHAAAFVVARQILDEKLGGYKLSLFSNSRREDTTERRDTYEKNAQSFLKNFAPTITARLSRASRTPFEPTESPYSTDGYV